MADGGVAAMKWTVGVITAPREKGYYLDRTLISLDRAGWGEPTVFAEPGSVVPDFKGNVVRRPKTYGDWTNWATGFYELLLSNPDTDYFLMVEDDAVVCAGAKHYLEYALPRLGAFGSLSLYTPSLYQHKRNLFVPAFHNELRERKTWSTVTVVMSRDRAIEFFSDPKVQRHRFEDIFGEDERFWCCPKTDPKNSIKDAVIGQWCEKHNHPVYYHTPSLAEHVGDFSTLTDQESTVQNGRRSADFVGEEADLLDWIDRPFMVKRHSRVPLS